MCLFFVVFSVAANAQTQQGELRVRVALSNGELVAADAELVSEAAKIRQRVHVGSNGEYAFKNLPYGRYQITITSPGLSTASEAVEVRSEIPQSVSVRLSVASVQTHVDVNADETLVDRQRAGTSYFVSRQELKERTGGQPGRGLVDLIAMQPGWTLEANGILHPRESEYDTQFVVNGFPMRENRSPAFARPMDAEQVESMQVYNGGIPPEFGGKLGGVIQVNTESNPNPGFHGTAEGMGGSFGTGQGHVALQNVGPKTALSFDAEGFRTSRYLDPPVTVTTTNTGSGASWNASVEHDITSSDRVRLAVLGENTTFDVPNDLLQQAAGQHQRRGGDALDVQASYQHVFSPVLLGSVRASYRRVTADLASNDLSTPIVASQNRSAHTGYVNASLSGQWQRHDWKAGAEATYTSLREAFEYRITSYDIFGVPIFDDVPSRLQFRGHATDREQAAYVQDSWRLGQLTVSGGIRFDHYNLLVDEVAWSPRVGVAWAAPRFGSVFHASYDRIFGTPPTENLLVSASPSVRFDGVYLPLSPARGNYYEVGLRQPLGNKLRLDANYFIRTVRNFEDDDLLLNTGVSFPIAYESADIHGLELKLEIPQVHKFSGFVSYANTVGTGHFPIAGGLFLDAGSSALLNSTERFPLSQDQRNVASAWLRYGWSDRVWTAISGSYGSGFPVEDMDEAPALDLLTAQFGSRIVQQVNFDRGRVRPSFAMNASVGAMLIRHEHQSLTAQLDARNIFDRLNVINFSGLFSGTAIAPPRGCSVKLRWEF